jgi:hypothetical protein
MEIEFVTHYYQSVPFRSLSALSRSEAIKIMEELYQDIAFYDRFRDPIQYWGNRKETEKWLIEELINKGGKPTVEYPIYAVLGSSPWIENYSINNEVPVKKIQMPVSIFNESDISFTIPDSMVSYWIARDKPVPVYNTAYHGKLFTLSEMKSWKINELIELIETTHPNGTIPYIEAQIWNHEVAKKYILQNDKREE